jgi:hypothetical protein
MTAPRVIFGDTETTSLRRPWMPAPRRVWDIGLIIRDPGKPDREWQRYVSDVDLRDADPFSLRIGKFWDRHPLYMPQPWPASPALVTEEGLAAELVRLITPSTHIVGAVPDFDVDSLAEMAWRHGLPWSAHYHLVDIETRAVGYLDGRNAEWMATHPGEPFSTSPYWPLPSLPWQSDDLWTACGVPPAPEGDRHTAIGDSRAVRDLWDAITGGRSDG